MKSISLILAAALAVAAMGALAPTVSADETCEAAAGAEACAVTYDYETGRGTCAAPDSWYSSTEYVGVRLREGGDETNAYATWNCYAYSWASGEGITAGTYGWQDGQYTALIVSWWSNSGGGCSVMLVSWNNEPVPDGATNFPCPAGEGPPALGSLLP